MLWLPALVPMLFGSAVFAFALTSGRPIGRGPLAAWAAAGTVATFGGVVLAASHEGIATLAWSPALALHLSLTPLSTLVALLVPLVALPVIVYAARRESEAGLARLIGGLLLFTGAMEWLVSADDLLTLLIGWELVGACSWALIAHEWRDPANPAAARYAFVATRLGDLGLFIAAMAAYAGAGSFGFADLGRLDPAHLNLVAASVLLAATAKSGQLPFSPWLFQAMRGPTAVSALLHAATMVAAGAYLLARLQPVLASVAWFGPAALAIGGATAIAGGVVALVQSDVKKVLAASTSAHFGLMFMAIGAGFPGVAALHLLAHGFMKALLFLCAGLAIDRSGGHDLATMRLGRALPWVAAAAAIGSAALAGLPPMGAAWTKEAIVAAATHTGPGWAIGVVVAGGLSAAYAVRWWWLTWGWGDKADAKADDSDDPDDPDDKSAAGAPAASSSSRTSPTSPMPGTTVYLALGWLAVATVSLSGLWWPQLRELVLAPLGITVPTAPTGWTIAALLAVLIGGLAGRVLALRETPMNADPILAPIVGKIADWWGLPMLIDAVVVRPIEQLARLAASADDRFVDALPQAVGRAGRALAFRLAAADDRVVDRGVAGTTAFVEWLARIGSHLGETVADGVASVPSRLVAFAANDARRLQTGLSHQAFAVLLIGTVLLGALLFIGG